MDPCNSLSDATGRTIYCSYPDQPMTKLSLSLGHVTTQSFRSGIVTLTLWPNTIWRSSRELRGHNIQSRWYGNFTPLSFMDNLLTPHHTQPNKKAGGSAWHRTVEQEPVLRSKLPRGRRLALLPTTAGQQIGLVVLIYRKESIHRHFPVLARWHFCACCWTGGTCVFILGKGVRGRIMLKRILV